MCQKTEPGRASHQRVLGSPEVAIPSSCPSVLATCATSRNLRVWASACCWPTRWASEDRSLIFFNLVSLPQRRAGITCHSTSQEMRRGDISSSFLWWLIGVRFLGTLESFSSPHLSGAISLTLPWVWRPGSRPGVHCVFLRHISCPMLDKKGVCKATSLGNTTHCATLVNSSVSEIIGPCPPALGHHSAEWGESGPSQAFL